MQVLGFAIIFRLKKFQSSRSIESACSDVSECQAVQKLQFPSQMIARKVEGELDDRVASSLSTDNYAKHDGTQPASDNQMVTDEEITSDADSEGVSVQSQSSSEVCSASSVIADLKGRMETVVQNTKIR